MSAGMIYITRPQDFPDKRPFPILDWFDAEIEEWGSTQPVSPLARIRVSPQDFPYLDKVQFSLLELSAIRITIIRTDGRLFSFMLI